MQIIFVNHEELTYPRCFVEDEHEIREIMTRYGLHAPGALITFNGVDLTVADGILEIPSHPGERKAFTKIFGEDPATIKRRKVNDIDKEIAELLDEWHAECDKITPDLARSIVANGQLTRTRFNKVSNLFVAACAVADRNPGDCYWRRPDGVIDEIAEKR